VLRRGMVFPSGWGGVFHVKHHQTGHPECARPMAPMFRCGAACFAAVRQIHPYVGASREHTFTSEPIATKYVYTLTSEPTATKYIYVLTSERTAKLVFSQIRFGTTELPGGLTLATGCATLGARRRITHTVGDT